MEVHFVEASYQMLRSEAYDQIGVGTRTLAEAFADGFSIGGIAVAPDGMTVMLALQRAVQAVGRGGAAV